MTQPLSKSRSLRALDCAKTAAYCLNATPYRNLDSEDSFLPTLVDIFNRQVEVISITNMRSAQEGMSNPTAIGRNLQVIGC